MPEDQAQLIRDNAHHILRAANLAGVDARTLAAIILRENLDNIGWKEQGEKLLGFYSETWPMGSPSIGLAQVQVKTARFLEEQGYIKPTSGEEGGWELPLIGAIHGTTNMAREKRLENPFLNAQYAAAYMKYFTDLWSPAFPAISERPDILATLYNLGHEITEPNPTPQANDFGKDVQSLYPLMGHLLGVACGDGDYARCEGTLDQLQEASTTVFLGGLPAARVGDKTCHEGVVVSGFSTVLIGG